MELAPSGNPGEVGMRIVGFQGAMEKNESELNLEALLCMSDEGEWPDGGLGIKLADIYDKTAGDFLPEKFPFHHASGGGALVDDPGPNDNFSSCGQPTRLGWWPSPALTGSSPTSPGGSGMTYGCKNSGEQSDEEDDLETEAAQSEQSLDGNELKRIRRMVSNRESARRSRVRKQAHLNELESKVDQLRGENSSLFKQLTDISLQCDDAASNNLVLKSDVEALRTTVKWAQDLIAGGPLANIVTQHLLQQASTSPPLTSWNMYRPLIDIPQVLDNGCYQDASSLTETLTIEAERSGSDMELKTHGSLPMQRTTNTDQLQNRICDAADTWPCHTSPMTKPC